MLSRFRGRSGFVAAVLAALFATVGAPHTADPRHDSDRAIVVVPHDEANHQVRPANPASDSHETHCVLCHFTRSFRPRADGRALSAPPAQALPHYAIEVFAADSTGCVAQPPLRAPPVSPKTA
ncbi:MAG TPA: hypothetical protein VM818_12590 [Vicinamibacterales bacterium]|nr:hypothetical protein [Vicinamibacterales bacterium]